MNESESSKPFDVFELCAAVLLGLGAIGAAVSGHQAGLWGGQSVEGYGEAAAMTTKASTTYNDELTSYIQDAQVDTRAKEMIWEALEINDEARKTRLLQMASWLYVSQLSDAAYAALKLPNAPEQESASETPAAATASADESADSSSEQATELEDEGFVISEAELASALNIDLDEDYTDQLFATSVEDFAAADKRFDVGRVANEIGDKFSLAGVIFTIALFFGGLALVFKTKVRWGFLGAGTIVFVAGAIFMATLTWA
jgi:hypothetical protein